MGGGSNFRDLSELGDLADEDALFARLESALGGELERDRGAASRIVVGVATPSRSAYAATLHPQKGAKGTAKASAGAKNPARTAAKARIGRSHRPQASASERTVRTGCLTKLLTSALALRACAEGRVALDAEIAAIMPAARALEGITLRHLLEHRHGLDDSSLATAPYRGDGFIAGADLADRLARTRLAGPGELYSYSNAGAWLTAAALEHTSGRRYVALLGDLLERPPVPRRPCPALGRSLTVPVRVLLELARRHAPWPAGAEAREATAALPGEAIAPLPGWNPFERGICLGWKHYGGGWVGHNSVWPGASSLLRVEPRCGVALFVASTPEPAAVWAARLFGGRLPDLVGPRVPRGAMPAAGAAAIGRYAGLYRCAALTARVERDSRGGAEDEAEGAQPSGVLTLEATAARGRRTFTRRTLRPAADHVFFTDPLDAETFPFVQFIEPCEAGFRYLWNGRFVLRNAACPFATQARRGGMRSSPT
jgi:CubicO group peptidase (beta-lactamase class C family)